MLIVLSEDYSAYGLARPGSVPFPLTINALLYAWLWVPTVGLVGIYMVLLFPDGRRPSKRWRALAWLAGAVAHPPDVPVVDVCWRRASTALLIPRKGADLLAEVRVGFYQGLDVPVLDIGGLNAGALRAREQGEAGIRVQSRGVEGSARQEKLRALACPEVGADRDYLPGAVREEHEDLQRVAQVVVVELVGANPVHDYLGVWGDKEVERRAVWAVALVSLRKSVGRYLEGVR